MDIKLDLKGDGFPDGELFEINDDNCAITKPEWVVKVDGYPDPIQLILTFEIVDLDSIDGDYEEPEFPISIWGHALIHPRHYCQKYLHEIYDDDPEEISEGYSIPWALSDAMSYNCGMNFYPEDELYYLVKKSEMASVVKSFDEGDYRHFKTGSDAYDYIHDVYVPALLKVGKIDDVVYINQLLNRIGTTGIDYINNVVRGDELFEPAMQRWKNGNK